LILADHLRAAARDRIPGEAAVAVADLARDGADARHLLGMLGLGPGVPYRWNMHRVAATAVAKSRLGQEFSANTLRQQVPPRAHKMIASAIAALTTAGLAEPARAVRSTAPGAKGRKVPSYRLTRAGEWLAMDIAPLPGVGDRLAINRLVLGGPDE